MKGLLSAPLSSRKLVEYLLLFLLLASIISAAVYWGYWYGKKSTMSVVPLRTSQNGSTKKLPSYTSEAVQIKVRDPFSDQVKAYLYKFTFNKKADDAVKLIPAGHQDQEFYSGIEVTRNGVKITIQPAFEGVSEPYYDKKPEVFKLNNSNLAPMYRVRSKEAENKYVYVSDYAEGPGSCNQWSPQPLACHMSNVYVSGGTGLDVSCIADSANVSECDDIIKSLDVQVSAL